MTTKTFKSLPIEAVITLFVASTCVGGALVGYATASNTDYAVPASIEIVWADVATPTIRGVGADNCTVEIPRTSSHQVVADAYDLCVDGMHATSEENSN